MDKRTIIEIILILLIILAIFQMFQLFNIFNKISKIGLAEAKTQKPTQTNENEQAQLPTMRGGC